MRMIYVIVGWMGFITYCFMMNGCEGKQTPEQRTAASKQYLMNCTTDLAPEVGYSIYRCENDEVVCYGYGGHGVSCHFKSK